MPYTILVVDDEPEIADLIELYLKNEGFAVHTCYTASAALACIEEAENALRLGMTWDAVTVSLEGAVAALNELTGERVSDAVVDRVFEKFCVGK